mgnify:CR=1 FL=1
MITKYQILGSDYVGVFATANDKYAIIGNDLPRSVENIIRDILEINDVFKLSIDGSDFVGIFVSSNENGILIPDLINDYELEILKEQIKNNDLNVEVMHTKLNALRNNILANDKIAIINPEFNKEEEKKISDVLGVETIRLAIGGYNTTGANNIITNKGIVINTLANDNEISKINNYFKNIVASTANLGSTSIGLSVIANSKGMIIGKRTSGYEISRIAEALDLQ